MIQGTRSMTYSRSSTATPRWFCCQLQCLLDVLEVTKKFMRDPLGILVKKEELTLEGIRQFYINVERVSGSWTHCATCMLKPRPLPRQSSSSTPEGRWIGFIGEDACPRLHRLCHAWRHGPKRTRRYHEGVPLWL